MRRKKVLTFLLFAFLIIIICSATMPVFSLQNNMSIPSYGTINHSGLPTPSPTPTTTSQPTGKYVGFRYNDETSTYNVPQWGTNYWLSVANRYVSLVSGSTAVAQWILPESTAVNFNQAMDNALSILDSNGVYVFLQPGEDDYHAADPYQYDLGYLIDATLANYGHHSCVLGVGFDLEMRGANWWTYVYTTDAEATQWVNKVKSYNSNYKLFLKHWNRAVMPPTVRNGIVFVDDSQGFNSLSSMVAEFRAWGNSFSGAEVGFGVGYVADQWWWSQLSNPPRDVAQALFDNIPNAKWVYWVNFSIHEVFP
jgi:hypothetical protein